MVGELGGVVAAQMDSVRQAKGSSSRGRREHPIQVKGCDGGMRVVRLDGARYAVHTEQDARIGAWLRAWDALPAGSSDVFPEQEARTILGFLRVIAAGGRPAAKSTTEGGRFIDRACTALNMNARTLAEKIGVNPSTLSYARIGRRPLSQKNRAAIKALLRKSTDTDAAPRRKENKRGTT
jgi:hypothetical protein